MNKRRRISPGRWVEIMSKFNWNCTYCGEHATTLDHIIPCAYHENNSDDNLVAACRRCNSMASDLVFNGFEEKWAYLKAKRENGHLPAVGPIPMPPNKMLATACDKAVETAFELARASKTLQEAAAMFASQFPTYRAAADAIGVKHGLLYNVAHGQVHESHLLRRALGLLIPDEIDNGQQRRYRKPKENPDVVELSKLVWAKVEELGGTREKPNWKGLEDRYGINRGAWKAVADCKSDSRKIRRALKYKSPFRKRSPYEDRRVRWSFTPEDARLVLAILRQHAPPELTRVVERMGRGVE